MPCKSTVYNSFPKFLLMRTKQPEGMRIKLIKTQDKFTEEFKYRTYKENTPDKLITKIIFNEGRNEQIIGRYIYQVQKGDWELVEPVKDGAAGESAASVTARKEPQFLSMAEQRRYEYLKNKTN